MKYISVPVYILFSILLGSSISVAQDTVVHPSSVIHGEYLGLSIPFRDAPVLSQQQLEEIWKKNNERKLNKTMRERHYPFADKFSNMGNDPALQDFMGEAEVLRAIEENWEGDQDGSFPPDPCGDVGPNHYIQAYNSAYSIYNKTGSRVAGPTALNTLFVGLVGGECNSGDPIILYDEQADRWVIVEFSLCNADDRVMVAVSETNDPTGSYHGYSFDTDEVPDYEKLGVWRDGYYMATNTHGDGNDIYVLERSQMLIGGAADMQAFENLNRPAYYDNFMCVPPADNDGAFADVGEPGIFICHADNAITSLTNDELWLFELDVDWNNSANSSFNRVQRLTVNNYDSNFGSNWDNIAQSGTATELDALPAVIMNAPQYRNFGSYETIVCCHTVDVDNTDHAGIRWYELRRTTGNWYIRQQGTYAPDAHSRWMGSIRLNGNKEIALGYSISSSTIVPGIRVCGQNALEYDNASGVLNVAELTVSDGTSYQTHAEDYKNRWGDYSSLNVDPSDDRTFWYTNMTVENNHTTKQTHIASFNVYPSSIYVDGNAAAGGNGTSGSPIQTVSEAIYAAGAGTVIYVAPDTYYETMTVDKEVYIYRWGSSGSVVIE